MISWNNCYKNPSITNGKQWSCEGGDLKTSIKVVSFI